MTLPAASSRCELCLPSAHPLRLFMTASDSVCVQQVFPDAEITAQYWSPSGRDMVQIKDAKSGVEIAKVAQRDLYRKYNWPAKDEIVQRLQMFKEEMES